MKIGVRRLMNRLFLSTLSLRRATQQKSGDGKTNVNFYPRSPCGERQGTQLTVADVYKISIHALLAESDLTVPDLGKRDVWISIHALLAESDLDRRLANFVSLNNFYPRSPCGERHPR